MAVSGSGGDRAGKWISTQGLRIDALILKKDPSVNIDSDICRIFRVFNILEYKRNDDDLNVDVFAKVMAYAHLYKSMGKSVDAIPYSEVTATIYRHAYPQDTFKKLEELGLAVEEKYPGVFYVSGNPFFPVQVIVGRRLDPKDYAMFRVLVPGASDDDIRIFKDMAVKNKDAAFQQSVDNIFQVSVSANKETYARLLKEDTGMCEALRELMKEDFIKTEVNAEARGEAKGLNTGISGTVKILQGMEIDDDTIKQKIMDQYNLEAEDADQYFSKPVMA